MSINLKKQRIQRHEVYFRALFDHHQKGEALRGGHNLPLQRSSQGKVPQASSIDASALSWTNSSKSNQEQSKGQSGSKEG